MSELFDNLLPFYWRGVEVPVREFRMTVAHDLVMHKPWGVDGARVEATGLEPTRFQLTIPFFNHLAPGVNEGWISGDLYPTVYREFLSAFNDRSTGHLQHPEFGLIACKPEGLETTWIGTARNGVEVTATFVETLDDSVQHKVQNGYVELDAAAVDFDTKFNDLKKLVPELPEYEATFADLARAIQGFGDQIGLLQYRTAGQVKSVLYRLDNIERAFTYSDKPRFGEPLDPPWAPKPRRRHENVLLWPAKREVEIMRSAAYEVQRRAEIQARQVLYYTTKDDTTLAALLPQLPGAQLADLIILNRHLMATPYIPAETQIRYYAPRAA